MAGQVLPLLARLASLGRAGFRNLGSPSPISVGKGAWGSYKIPIDGRQIGSRLTSFDLGMSPHNIEQDVQSYVNLMNRIGEQVASHPDYGTIGSSIPPDPFNELPPIDPENMPSELSIYADPENQVNALGSIIDRTQLIPTLGMSATLKEDPSTAQRDMEQPAPSAALGSAIPQRASFGERLTDKLADFLRGYGQGTYYGDSLSKGAQAVAMGAQARETRAKQKQAYMEQGFTEAQAEAMIADPKYRDKMIEQQGKLRESQMSRLGQDMEWVRDEKGNIIGQKVIVGSSKYMQLKKEYAHAIQANTLISVSFKNLNRILTKAENIIRGTDTGGTETIASGMPTTGRIAQGIAYAFPKTKQGRLHLALKGTEANVILNELKSLRDQAKSGASGLGQTTHRELDVLANVYEAINISVDDQDLLETIAAIREKMQVIENAQRQYIKYINPNTIHEPWSDAPEPAVFSQYSTTASSTTASSQNQNISETGVPDDIEGKYLKLSYDEAKKRELDENTVIRDPNTGQWYYKKKRD